MALSPWVRPLAYCEINPDARAVLLSRMRYNEITAAPVWDDVTALVRGVLPGDAIDIIYAGFPCTDISVAGSRAGLDGQQSGLFYQVVRVVSECRPEFVFLENVARGIGKYIPTIKDELETLGYECRDGFLRASDIGANHERDRWFLLAYANSVELREQPRRRDGQSRKETPEYFRFDWWTREPKLPRVAYGVPRGMERRKLLGNAVVPLQAREAFKELAGIRE